MESDYGIKFRQYEGKGRYIGADTREGAKPEYRAAYRDLLAKEKVKAGSVPGGREPGGVPTDRRAEVAAIHQKVQELLHGSGAEASAATEEPEEYWDPEDELNHVEKNGKDAVMDGLKRHDADFVNNPVPICYLL